MNQPPFPSTTPESLDLALDAFAGGDSMPLDTIDPDTAATWSLLQEWTLHGGLDGLEPHKAASTALTTNHSSAWSPRPQSKGLLPMQQTSTVHRVTIPPTAPPRRLTGTVFNAVAWLVILALAGGAIWGVVPHLRDGRDESPRLSVFADATPATTPEATRSSDVNLAGDSGHSWALGKNPPSVSHDLPGGPIVDPGSRILTFNLIVGDSLFFTYIDDNESRLFARYDFATNTTVWTTGGMRHGFTASDGIHVFGYEARTTGAKTYPVPIAVSIETGEVVWEGPALELGSDSNSYGPVIMDGTVYFSDTLGNTLALDPADGSLRWQYPEHFLKAVTYTDFDEAPESPPTGDIVATANGIFTVLPSLTIVRLDPTSGQEIESINIVDRFGQDIERVSMQATDELLMVYAQRTDKASPGSGLTALSSPVSIMTLDPTSLSRRISATEVRHLAGNPVFSDGTVYFIGQMTPGNSVGVFRFEPNIGGEPETLVDSLGSSRWHAVSLVGSSLMINGPDGRITIVDTDSGAIVSESEPDHAQSSTPVLIWGATPVTVANDATSLAGTRSLAQEQPVSPPVDAPADSGSTVTYGGDPGKSWVLSEDDPLWGEATILGTLADGPVAISSPPLIVGDIMIVTMQVGPDAEDPAAYETVGYNLASREIVWTADRPLHGPFASDGEYVAGYVLGADVDRRTRVPAVARLDDGSMLMQYVLPAFQNGPAHSTTNVTVHDGIAYLGHNLGHVWAVDIATQEVLWADVNFGAGYLNFPEAPGFASGLPPSDLIVTDQYVFTIRPSMTVIRYNRLTGQQNGSFNLVDELNGDISSASLQAVGNKLVIAAHREPRTTGDYAPTSILVYGLDSLDFFTRADIAAVDSNLVVTLEWIYVVGRTSDAGNSHLHRINPVTGELSERLGDYQAPGGANTGLSLAGSTLMITGPTTVYTFVDIGSREVIESGIIDANAEVLLPDVPAQLWSDRPVAITTLGTIVVFGEVPEG